MANEHLEAKRDLVREILQRYHKTRLAGDPVDFIMASEHVQLRFSELIGLYITG